jgi:hypothetical protein
MPLILLCSAGAFCTTYAFGTLVGLPHAYVTGRAALDCVLHLFAALCLDWRRRNQFLAAQRTEHGLPGAKAHSTVSKGHVDAAIGQGKVKVC